MFGNGCGLTKPMLLLATSCLQGRQIDYAINQLLSLQHVDGLQLCPGNLPIARSDIHTLLQSVKANNKVLKRHHGYSETDIKESVWRKVANGHYFYSATHIVNNQNSIVQDSVHPPPMADFLDDTAPENVILEYPSEVALEIMYVSNHNYPLTTIEEVKRAMDNGQALALDLSHVDINQKFGRAAEWEQLIEKLLDYKKLKEIHMSQSIHERDAHARLSSQAFKLDVAREWHKRNKVLVLECYMHKMSQKERQDQINLLVEA